MNIETRIKRLEEKADVGKVKPLTIEVSIINPDGSVKGVHIIRIGGQERRKAENDRN